MAALALEVWIRIRVFWSDKEPNQKQFVGIFIFTPKLFIHTQMIKQLITFFCSNYEKKSG